MKMALSLIHPFTGMLLFLLMGSTTILAQSPPGEVANLVIQGDILSWEVQPEATSYNLYRGDLSSLSATDYGTCRAPGLPTTSFPDPDLPALGSGFFYLVTGVNSNGEGTAGNGNPGPSPRPVVGCTPGPNLRYNAYTLNGDPGDGIPDGNEPRRNPDGVALGRCSHCSDRSGFMTVWGHTGEFFHQVIDLRIPGRGFDFVLERTYRNQVSHDGTLGHGWRHPYEAYIEPDAGLTEIRHHDGRGHVDLYLNAGGGVYEPATPGRYRKLFDDGGTFTLRDRDGTKYVFGPFDGSRIRGALLSISDRDGNRMRFLYDLSGNLSTVIDTLGRPIYFDHDASTGRLLHVTDFDGRTVTYGYDENGDLISATSPRVIGTPNGNDFPQGKTTLYSYTNGKAAPSLNHNLATITAPNEASSSVPSTPRVRIFYGLTSGLIGNDFDRVTLIQVGGTNANGTVGGDHTFSYQFLNVGNPDPFLPRRQTTWFDRAGNREELVYYVTGNLLQRTEFTNRDVHPGDPDSFTTSHAYNAHGELIRTHYPEMNVMLSFHDDSNPDRFQQGNLLEVRRVADARRKGDQTAIVTTFAYEPVFNQVRSTCDPRGNDPGFVPPVDPVARGCSRYSTTHTFDYEEACDFGAIAAELRLTIPAAQSLLAASGMCGAALGDVNGDGSTNQVRGNRVRTRYPAVHLIAGSNQALLDGTTRQEIQELQAFNQFGQAVKRVDAEGNVTELSYHPEIDPDGDGAPNSFTPGLDQTTGGYLKEIALDTTSAPGRDSGTNPPPTNIRRQIFYDRVGNKIREINGRGIEARYAVNELNQVVQVARAAAHGAFTADPTEPVPLVDFGYRERLFYDYNDNVVGRQVEDRHDLSNTGAFVDFSYAYDILDDTVETRAEASLSDYLVTRYAYDANQNSIQVTKPEGNFNAKTWDERDLLFQETRGAGGPFGGVPSTTCYYYDGNGSLKETADAADTDGSGGNNSTGGCGFDRTLYILDGFDRRTSIIDRVGNQVVYQYDPKGNSIREARFGPSGAPSPTNNGPQNPPPVSINGVIQSAALSNPNLLQSTESIHDELDRVYQVDRGLFATTVSVPDISDGAGDLANGAKGDLTPGDTCEVPGVQVPLSGWLGCVSTRTEYDRLSRRTFMVEDDSDTTRYLHDGAGRLIKTIDPEGNTVEKAYDDENNLIEVRETDVPPEAPVPNEVFLTTNFFDSLNRLQRSVDNLGRTTDNRYDSRGNLVARADAEGPVLGASIARRSFSPGPNTIDQVNGFGNVTLSSYDGINRLIRRDVILTPTGEGDGVNIGATLEGDPSAIPSPDPNQAADGRITTRFTYDRNSRLVAFTDDKGNQTAWFFDNLDRSLTETKGICVPPTLADICDTPTITSREYDPDDNLTRIVDENGSQVTCAFDAINRKTRCDILPAPGPAPAVVGTTLQTFQYDGLSRLTQSTDNNQAGTGDDVIVTNDYESLGNVIRETQGVGLTTYALRYGWRAGNLTSTLGYPNGRLLRYGYDKLDRVTTVGDPGQPVIARYDYIGRGTRLLTRTHGNGTELRFWDPPVGTSFYDGDRNAREVINVGSDESVLLGFAYTYDRVNHRLDQTKLHDPTCSESYGYTSSYWLDQFSRACFAPPQSIWDYDGAGNWKAVCDASAACETRTTTSFNEYASITASDGRTFLLEYDDNGNIRRDSARLTYQYDALNRLVTVSDPAGGLLFRNVYDASGRRIRKVEPGVAAPRNTDYVHAGREVIEERANNVLARQYVLDATGKELVALDVNRDGNASAVDPSDQRLFYHPDALGTEYGLTDSNGTLVEATLYDGFGSHKMYRAGQNGFIEFGSGDDTVVAGGDSAFGNPYLFQGSRSEGFNLYSYPGGRYYHSTLGHFLSRAGHGGMLKGRSSAVNLYMFAGNDPTNRHDAVNFSSGIHLGTAWVNAPTRPLVRAARDFGRPNAEALSVEACSGSAWGLREQPGMTRARVAAGSGLPDPHLFEGGQQAPACNFCPAERSGSCRHDCYESYWCCLQKDGCIVSDGEGGCKKDIGCGVFCKGEEWACIADCWIPLSLSPSAHFTLGNILFSVENGFIRRPR